MEFFFSYSPFSAIHTDLVDEPVLESDVSSESGGTSAAFATSNA